MRRRRLEARAVETRQHFNVACKDKTRREVAGEDMCDPPSLVGAAVAHSLAFSPPALKRSMVRSTQITKDGSRVEPLPIKRAFAATHL